jgi:hypothetical protein
MQCEGCNGGGSDKKVAAPKFPAWPPAGWTDTYEAGPLQKAQAAAQEAARKKKEADDAAAAAAGAAAANLIPPVRAHAESCVRARLNAGNRCPRRPRSVTWASTTARKPRSTRKGSSILS